MKLLFLLIILCFQSISFAQPLVPFLKGSLYGYSDVNGKLIIEALYDEAFLFDSTYNYAQVRLEDKYYVINRKGEKLEGVAMDCKMEFKMLRNLGTDFRNSRLYQDRPDKNPSTSNIVIIELDYKCRGNYTKRIIFNPEKFDPVEIAPLFDPLCSFVMGEPSYYIQEYLFASLTSTNPYGIFDRDLNLICYSQVKPSFINESQIYYFDKGGYTYDTEKGKISKLPFAYLKDIIGYDNLIVCTKPKSNYKVQRKIKCGICDKNFKLIVDTMYHDIFPLGENYIGYRKLNNSLSDLINAQGEILIEGKSRIEGIKNNEIITATDTLGKVSVYDKNISKLKLEDYTRLHWDKYDKHFRYKRDNISGLLDSNLNFVFEYPAESVSVLGDIFRFTEDKKQGLVNKDKDLIVQNEYKYIHKMRSGHIRLETFSKKYGLVTPDGQMMLDTIYDDIEIDTTSIATYINAKMDNLWTCFDPTGRVIVKDQKDRLYPLSTERKNKLYAKNIHVVYLQKGKSIEESLTVFMKKNGASMNPKANLGFRLEDGNNYACQQNLTFITDSKNEKVAIIKANEKNRLYAFKTSEGEGIVSFENDVLLAAGDRRIHDIADNYIVVVENKTYAIYNLALKKMYPYNFHSVHKSYDDTALTEVSKKIPGSRYTYVKESCLTNSIDTITAYKYRKGYINKNGEIEIPLRYSTTTKFDNGRALVCNIDENDLYQCYIIDTLGQVKETFGKGIEPYNWDDSKEYLLAKNEDNIGFIYKNGDILVDIKYKSLYSFFDYKVFMVYEHDDTNYLVNRNGYKIYTNTKMEDKDDRRFLALPNDRLLVYPDGEMQIINIETGKKFVKFSGDKAELIENDELALIKVYLNGKYYYVNPLNNMIYKN